MARCCCQSQRAMHRCTENFLTVALVAGRLPWLHLVCMERSRLVCKHLPTAIPSLGDTSFYYCLARSQQGFADKLPPCMQTTGGCSNLLATNAITVSGCCSTFVTSLQCIYGAGRNSFISLFAPSSLINVSIFDTIHLHLSASP